MKTINSLLDLIKIIDKMYDYLQGKIAFDQNQCPLFKREHILDKYPQMIVPYDHRNDKIVKNKAETLICFYNADVRNYSRINNVLDEIDNYKGFLGVASMDITVTADMDIELQRFIIYSNILFMAVLAVNDIKVVLNTRIGSPASLEFLKFLPKNMTCISGFLGCKNSNTKGTADLYINKILYLLPRRILIYGKEDKLLNDMLDTLGMEYKYYVDFHQLSKKENRK